MSRNRNEELENNEFFEQDRSDVNGYDQGKGLRPVSGYDMINFLEWLRRTHPEITRLEGLSPQRFSLLVSEYEVSTGSQANGNWLVGQRYLQDGYSNEFEYDRARRRKKQLGM